MIVLESVGEALFLSADLSNKSVGYQLGVWD